MREKRVDVLVSVASFLHLMFLGFAGALVAELVKDQKDDIIVFWSSFFASLLTCFIIYIYSELFLMTKYK